MLADIKDIGSWQNSLRCKKTWNWKLEEARKWRA